MDETGEELATVGKPHDILVSTVGHWLGGLPVVLDRGKLIMLQITTLLAVSFVLH